MARQDVFPVNVLPPLAGVSRRTGYQTQPPFSAYKSVNFWPTDPITGRAVTSTRPPLVDFTSPTSSSSGGVTFLNRVNGVAPGKPLQSMLATKGGELHWYNGTTWLPCLGDSGFETTTAIYGATYLQKTYIARFDGAPFVFDYPTSTVSVLVPTAGEVPTDCRIFAVWQGALWMAGRIESPHILFGSRTGDARDWNFAAPITDLGGAFFTGGENEGLLRGPITAMFAHTTDTMIVSTTEGIAALRGHPRRGGVFEDISPDYILGQGAWTKGPDDVAFFLTRLGMMALPATPNAVPTYISREKIPEELTALPYDYEKPSISMAFDARWNGIHITVRGTRQQAWWYDLATGGFHQMQFSQYPYRLMEYSPEITENTSGVLYGQADGIERMDRLGEEEFSSEIVIGPIRISPSSTSKSFIQSAVCVFGGDTPTTDGPMEIAVGADGEDAIARVNSGRSQFATTLETISENNGRIYPRLTGSAMAIKLKVETSGRLTFENIDFDMIPAGRNRMTRLKNATFSAISCYGYATATPSFGPEGGIEDGMEMVNLEDMPTEWWGFVNAEGGNIRVSDQSNNFLAFDVLGFDKTSNTGAISLMRDLPEVPTPVKIWVCDQTLAKFPPGSAFGQYFAYPPWYVAVWPSGIGHNRTPVDWETPTFAPNAENPFLDQDPQDTPEETPEVCRAVPYQDQIVTVLGMVRVPEGRSVGGEFKKWFVDMTSYDEVLGEHTPGDWNESGDILTGAVFPIRYCQGTEGDWDDDIFLIPYVAAPTGDGSYGTNVSFGAGLYDPAVKSYSQIDASFDSPELGIEEWNPCVLDWIGTGQWNMSYMDQQISGIGPLIAPQPQLTVNTRPPAFSHITNGEAFFGTHPEDVPPSKENFEPECPLIAGDLATQVYNKYATTYGESEDREFWQVCITGVLKAHVKGYVVMRRDGDSNWEDDAKAQSWKHWVETYAKTAFNEEETADDPSGKQANRDYWSSGWSWTEDTSNVPHNPV